MVDYVCEKCGKEFTQNGTYTKHKNKKNHCDSEKMNENKCSYDAVDVADVVAHVVAHVVADVVDDDETKITPLVI